VRPFALASSSATRKPASGEGEDAWCARQVAEHIAGASLFFGAGIAQAIGVDGPALERIELPDSAAAAAKTQANQAAFMAVAAHVKDDQLAMEVDHPRLGKQTLGGILDIDKEGWDYLELTYEDTEDEGFMVKKPIIATVHKVYRRADFDTLGL
jgi:hypothetical protein